MRVVLRTEGSHTLGMGDVWGSIGLADEFTRRRDEALFIVSGGPEAASAIKEKGYSLRTAACFDAEREVLRDFRPDVIVVNKLNNQPEYVRALRDLAGLIVTFDDAGEGARYADLTINAFFGLEGAVADQQYIPLKSEFRELRQQDKTIRDQLQELLVTQGGSDTYGFTPTIIRALDGMTCRPQCTVVIGPAFRHHAELKEAVTASTLNLALLQNPGNMSELMWDADLAITAGGLTMFELACVGTPSLVIGGECWDEQTAAPLNSAGALKYLGFGGDIEYARVPEEVDALAANAGERKRMSRLAQQLVDGRGCERAVTLVRERALQLGKAGR